MSTPTFPPHDPPGPVPTRPPRAMGVSAPAPTSAPARSAAGIVRRWWPGALAVAMAAAFWGIDVATAGPLLTLLPLVYVVLTVVGTRSASWPLLVLGTGGFVVLQAQSAVHPVLAIAALGAVAVAVGCVRSPGRELLVQGAAMVALVALVLVAEAVPLDTARVLLAIGWVAHGGWDLWHLRRDAVASRTYAQWCGVLDVLMGLQLLTA